MSSNDNVGMELKMSVLSIFLVPFN